MTSWKAQYQRVWNVIYRDSRLRAGVISYIVSLLFHSICQLKFGDLSSTIYYSFFVIPLIVLTTQWRNYMYSLQSYFLGFVTFFAIYSLKYSLMDTPLCINMYFMSIFHYFEFFVLAISNPDSLKPDSFLLNHSVPYWVAIFTGWAEYVLRTYFYPSYSNSIMFMGIIMCIIGEVLRKLAMWHAGSGFTHIVAYKKQKNHNLMTNGVYRICRHPAYVGFFLFSVGTQVMLNNPICTVAFAYVCIFKFFKERIYDEERYLVSFFGHQYIQYQKDVPIGLPFVKGYTLQE